MPKISQLTSIAGVTGDDLFVVVNDPLGSPSTRKVTAQGLLDFVDSGLNLGSMAAQSMDNVTITGGTASLTGLFNVGLTLASNSFSTAKMTARSQITNFKSVGDTTIFTVPTGYMFLVDTMEIITISISEAGQPPKVRFGVGGTPEMFHPASPTTSNSFGSRHIIENPQDGVDSGTAVVFGITEASTAASHQGAAVVSGYLLKKT